MDENIYTQAMQKATQYMIGIDEKLRSYGTYGIRKKTKEDVRNEALVQMSEKYGEQAMADLIARHEEK